MRSNIRFVVLAFAFLSWSPASAEDAAALDTLHIVKQNGEEILFHIETARTPEEQAKGLMFREHLPEKQGMLFIFPIERQAAFWMRNTLIPLDMIFIKSDGVIESIHANARPHDETPIPSQGPVKAVLEVNGGIAEKFNITAGDRVRHPVFGNPLAAE